MLQPVNATDSGGSGDPCSIGSHKRVSLGRIGRTVMYIGGMPDSPPSPSRLRRFLPLLAFAVLVAAAAIASVRGGFTFDTLVRHRAEILAFVAAHRAEAVLAYIGLYVVSVALSIPGATLLTVTGGFLFGVALGAGASIIGATAGAAVIFLIARTALGEPLLKRAGPKAAEMARGFRENAFSYLLFLRLVPAFPFFLVNLVPAVAGVRLLPFAAATALGVIPAALVYALAGTGLDSIITARQRDYAACLARSGTNCSLNFHVHDVLTPELIAALIGLGLLALVPVAVKRCRARQSATG